ncbi:MAG TPA: hypothetical protein PLD73_03815 [Candidatus Hydrogenedentes bacterium]|jgi:hypothetical protein|nr:hypothetical protein [Candidatus Hydrogenedentota bacterium]HPJ98679.1 hypothetical protein [Candidatus Hydrogenedentota bacterium]
MTQPPKNLGKKQQRALAHLDRNLQLSREFLNDWLLFNQILSAFPAENSNRPELENQFLKIKSKLAREHQILRESLGQDYRIDGNTMNIVAGATSLENIFSQSEIAVKKLQGEWHRAFISINETLGGLEDKRSRVLGGEKVFVGGLDSPTTGGGGISDKTKKTVIIIVVLLIIVGIMVGVPQIRDMYMDAFKDLFGGK